MLEVSDNTLRVMLEVSDETLSVLRSNFQPNTKYTRK